MKTKSIILAAALAAFFSPIGQAAPFRTVIPVEVICLPGAPGSEGGMFQLLLKEYHEQPIHALNLNMGETSIQMYITENRNNNEGRGSSSVMLYSNGANQTCMFWAAEDVLRTIPKESLPAKQPLKGETNA